MKLSMKRRSRRWVLRELDRSAAARSAQADILNTQTDPGFEAHSTVGHDYSAV
ncbi:hypothetical protein [Microvirga sp. VF16]|uniref:hypothetical protein n=1 Tax=Microvirga sp. VF16 TaxID=2807101 RepID=UPI00193D256C|nr:hypothetical protein [Microvirga sp. VF16]QRM34293.1 hypothetical protein JO965_34250 [Microvirga sp. VF16]